MLAHFYIPMPKNDMKLAVQKNHLGVKFCPEPVKKRRHSYFNAIFYRGVRLRGQTF